MIGAAVGPTRRPRSPAPADPIRAAAGGHPRGRLHRLLGRSVGGPDPRRARRRGDPHRGPAPTRRDPDEHAAPARPTTEWWEWSPLFCGANTNKRGIAVDLSTPAGHEIAMRLLATCDVMIENFSPRVVEQLGLGPDDVLAVNPRLTVVRMPAFGVSGPWRDRVGFAQTIEQASGLAFLTGLRGRVAGDAERDVRSDRRRARCDRGPASALRRARRDRTRPGRRGADDRRCAQHGRRAGRRVHGVRAPAARVPATPRRSPSRPCVRCAGDDEWVAITMPDERARQAIADATGATELRSSWRPGAPCANGGRRSRRSANGSASRSRACTWAHEVVEFEQLVARGLLRRAHPSGHRHPSVHLLPRAVLGRASPLEPARRRRRWAPTTTRCSASSGTTRRRSIACATTA